MPRGRGNLRVYNLDPASNASDDRIRTSSLMLEFHRVLQDHGERVPGTITPPLVS